MDENDDNNENQQVMETDSNSDGSTNDKLIIEDNQVDDNTKSMTPQEYSEKVEDGENDLKKHLSEKEKQSSPSLCNDEIVDKGEKLDNLTSKDQKESSRSETPPLKRLMRQDPLPLFMSSPHHSPPKKVFKEEHVAASKWQIPLVPTPSFLASVKNAPTHPRQHILKSKQYSNKLFFPPAALSSMSALGYPFSAKSYENEQPLDLSKKTGGLKSPSSSTASYSSSAVKHSSASSDIQLKSRQKYSNGLFPDSIKSSLQSLQQKFGGDYHTRLLQKPMKGLHALSYDLYSKACSADNILLNSIPPLPKKKSPIPPFVETLEKSSSEGSESTATNHKDLNSNFKHQNSVESDEDKHTRHKCVCTKTFTSLFDLSLHIQETGHLPAGVKKANLMEYPKLVRGQDMWLNTESEQTKRILRCMQCGESFKSLPMLTVHMMQTQHYTKIVSSEHGRRTHKCSAYCDRDVDRECVFKCKVCNSMFVDMEGLANHMILSGHHKRSILRSHNHTDLPLKANDRQGTEVNGETRKVPLSRSSPAQDRSNISSPDSDLADDSLITCENCGDRIETSCFVEHVRGCLHKTMVEAFESRIEKLKSQVNNLQSKTLKEEKKSEKCNDNSKENKQNKESAEKVKIENDHEKVESEGNPNFKEQIDGLETDLIKQKFIKTEPQDENDIEKRQKEGSDMSSPLKLSAKKLDILNPEADVGNEEEGNSALQAMESFIQKSFSSKFGYGKNKFKMNVFEKQESLSPLLKFEKYRKYFQPSLLMENMAKKTSSESEESEASDSTKDELEKLEKLCENVNKRQPSPKAMLDSADSKEVKSSNESLSSKYLNIDDEEQTSQKSSALDSLSSFVYGQSLDSEHPLDKLQKLITKTDIPGMKMPSQTVLNGSPEISIPLNLSLKREMEDEEMMEEMLSEGSHSDSGSDSAVEYHCVACSRHFASKGTYRYHLSRCHLSTIKKYGIKEAFNMSPYVYLPLDHTAKFSKYFKMAEELVKKEKEKEKERIEKS